MDYRDRFKKCGKNVTIDPDAVIEYPEGMTVGDNVRIWKGVVIMDQGCEIVLHDNVRIMPWVVIQTGGGYLELGKDFILYPNNYISVGGANGSVIVGHGSHFAPGSYVYGQGGTRVGDCVAMASGCMLAGVQHGFDDPTRPIVKQPGRARPVVIEDDCYLGANVTINGDVTVRTGCVIGANAVVTHDTEPFGFYTGIPATLKRWRKEPE